MVQRMKWVTQRITLLLEIALGIFLIPFMLAKALQFAGIVSSIDGLYGTNQVLFWVLTIISRLSYGGIWGGFSWWLFTEGDRRGWLWHKPDTSSYRYAESIDQSSTILGILLAGVLVFAMSEVAILISTGIMPPYVK